jgi:hypothetical protein
MHQVYARHGVRFRYPADWEISEQEDGSQFSITVSSPHTSFWTVTLLADSPSPKEIVAAVLDAFHEEYDELDEYPARQRLCGQPTVARDIDFVCLELLNVARVRAFRAPDFTVLVMYQGTEGEFDETGPILEQITGSLSLDREGLPIDAPDDDELEDEDLDDLEADDEEDED